MSQKLLVLSILICLESFYFTDTIVAFSAGGHKGVGDASSLKISCISSCSFASYCWGLGSKNHYIHCTWDDIDKKVNYKSSIQLDKGRKRCSQNVVCERENGSSLHPIRHICHVYILANNSECAFITTKGYLRYSVRAYNDSNKKVDSSSIYMKPCEKVKIDPPIIKEVKPGKNLQVTVSKPHCCSDSWLILVYKLRYITFDGSTMTPAKYLRARPFDLPLYSANQYSIFVSAAIENIPKLLRISSDEKEETYLTGPTTATDDDIINFLCSFKETNLTVVAFWKKSGIVDRFRFTITSLANLNDSRVTYLKKNFSNQTVFEIYINHLNLQYEYNMSVVAINQKGISRPTSSIFSSASCNSAGKKPTNCRRLSGGSDWMTIAWMAPLMHKSYNTFKVEITSNTDEQLISPSLSISSLNYNVTNLQTCKLYTINVLSFYKNVEVGACTFTSYGEETTTFDPPRVTLTSSANDFYFIKWTKPVKANGIICKYLMYIISEEISRVVEENPEHSCSIINDATECWFSGQQLNTTMWLPIDSKIQVAACTDDGKKCSKKSLQTTADQAIKLNKLGMLDGILIAVVCVITIFVLLSITYAYLSNSKLSGIKGPIIHPDILNDLSKLHISNRSETKDVKFDDAKQKISNCSCEDYTSVKEWRENVYRSKSSTTFLTEKAFFCSPDDSIKQVSEKVKTDVSTFGLTGTSKTSASEECNNSEDETDYCTSEQAVSLLPKKPLLQTNPIFCNESSSVCWSNPTQRCFSLSNCTPNAEDKMKETCLLDNYVLEKSLHIVLPMKSTTKSDRIFSGGSADSGISSTTSISPS